MAYTPYYPSYYPQQQNSIIWVQGEAGAKGYLVAAGSTVALWDSESPTIYIKTVDASGMPSIRVFDYVERAPQPKTSANNDYVTKAEFTALVEKVNALIKENENDASV